MVTIHGPENENTLTILQPPETNAITYGEKVI
jgi:hypothetical protein